MNASSSNLCPILVIVMGASGCGKTTLARSIAEHLDYEFIEADQFHSHEAVELMRSGTPLTDDDRKGWIKRLRQELIEKSTTGTNCTLAFSGLKSHHRKQIRDTGFECITLFLHGDRNALRARLEGRSDHFMPASLLESQFEALESPSAHSRMLEIDIAQTPQTQLDKSIAFINTTIT